MSADHRSLALAGLGLVSVAVLLGGCQDRESQGPASPVSSHAAWPATRATSPAPPAGPPAASRQALQIWENRAKGIRLEYPVDWQPRNDSDYDLMLAPAGSTGSRSRRITLDIPDLPPHLPFMIQMDRIQHDYLQDLRKRHADVKLLDARDVQVSEALARLVHSTWQQDRELHHDMVLFLIHASAVFILDAQTDADGLRASQAAFNAVRASLSWMK